MWHTNIIAIKDLIILNKAKEKKHSEIYANTTATAKLF